MTNTADEFKEGRARPTNYIQICRNLADSYPSIPHGVQKDAIQIAFMIPLRRKELTSKQENFGWKKTLHFGHPSIWKEQVIFLVSMSIPNGLPKDLLIIPQQYFTTFRIRHTKYLRVMKSYSAIIFFKFVWKALYILFLIDRQQMKRFQTAIL